MIRKILAVMVSGLENGTYEEELDIESAKRMQKWMEEIDHEAEIVPLEDKERLSRLMSHLKGDALNVEEQKLVDHITEN